MSEKSAEIIPAYSSYFTAEAGIYRDAFSCLDKSCVDITTLSSSNPAFGHDFLVQLLNRTAFSSEFQVDSQVDLALSGQYFQAKNDEKIKGQQVLGLAYPVLMSQQEKQSFSIPFFIWPVQLEAVAKQNFWKISYLPERPIQLNPFFTHFMMMRFGKDVEKDLQIRFTDGINSQQIAAFCNDLAQECGLETNSQQVSLMPCPGVEEFDCLNEQGAIQWSGVLGIFPAIPPHKSSDVLETFLKEEALPFEGNTFGIGLGSTSQSTVIQCIKNNHVILVDSTSQTEKSQFLHYFTTNALAKAGKCLIVSDKLPVLNAAQKKLSAQGLDELTFLLRDELGDKILLTKALKARAKNKASTKEENGTEYRILADKLHRQKEKMEARYAATRKLVFGNKNWQETVGLFLEAVQKEPKELLNSHLDALDFSFTEEELAEIIAAIKKAPALYKKVATISHPLSNLNTDIFLHKEESEALQFIQSTQLDFSKKASELQHRFILTQNNYAEQLKDYHESYFHNLRNIIADLKDKISDYSSHFGAELQKSGKGTLKLYGLFSDKFRKALSQREAIFSNYDNLQKEYKKQNAFEFSFEKSDKNVAQISQNLTLFEAELQDWWKKQTHTLKDELLRLSHKTAHPALGITVELKTLEEALDRFLEELNAADLYQLPMDCTTLTLPRRQKFLEEKMGLLEQTIYHLRDFSPFYAWQSFWVKLSSRSRKVIKALARVNPNHWEAAFKSWYFHNCLTLAYEPDLPLTDFELETYAPEMEILQTKISIEIKRQWSNKRNQKIEMLRDWVDDSSTETSSFKNILSQSLDLVTDFLPVLLATPQVAKHFPKGEKVFDYLLVDEAQTLFAENIIPLFPLAKRVVIFTNSGEEVKGNAALPSILEKAGIKRSQLHHNQTPPNIETQAINGRFDEAGNTNEEEARQVIHLLNSVQKTAQRTYPSVGIACFTREQRDLITGYLLRIKQQGFAGADIIQHLERNGLGVFLVDELRGQRFDTLIASTTYGETGVKNTLTQKIKHLNSPKGIAQMQLLSSRAKEKLHLIHSIPEKDWQGFLKIPANEGTYLLASLIQSKALPLPLNIAPISPVFINQIQRLLKKENPQSTFTKKENFLVQKERDSDTKKLLLPDGCFAQTANTDFAWEYRQRRIWEEKGYEVVPIWSVLWWKK